MDKIFGDEEEEVCAEKVVCKEKKGEQKTEDCAKKPESKPAVKDTAKPEVKPTVNASAPAKAPAPEKKPSSAPQKWLKNTDFALYYAGTETRTQQKDDVKDNGRYQTYP